MKRLFLALAIIPALALADEGLSVYSPWASFGLEVGALRPVNDSWNNETSAIFQGEFLANFQILPMMSVIGQAGYSAPGNGFDAQLGIQQQLLPFDITPFVDGLAGIRAVPDDDHTPSFGDRFGPTVSVDGGILFFRESWFQFRVRGGYQWTFDNDTDHGWQVGVGILFANSRPGLKAIDVSPVH